MAQQQQQRTPPLIPVSPSTRPRSDSTIVVPEAPLVPVSPLAVDIGGSLTKIVYWRPPNPPKLPEYINKEPGLENVTNFTLKPDPSLNVYLPPKGMLKFLKFPTVDAEKFVDFVKATKLHEQYGCFAEVNATGGGAFKYAPLVEQKLEIMLCPKDEMRCLIKGLTFLLENADNEIFEFYSPSDAGWPTKRFISTRDQDLFPFLITNIGSGVSILKVTAEGAQRISGSALGGATFWSLVKLLTRFRNFETTLSLILTDGDNKNVDLLVSDFYSADKTPAALKPSVIASSLGKVQRHDFDPHTAKDEDIVRSLLYMIADNIAQIAFLNAKLHHVKSVFFTGGFVMDNPIVWKAITWGVHFWSKGEMKAFFVRHDGYLGALGALLSSM
eukprot:TRINITY_DN3497_c0_g1_i3.p1 TRINITY_DN3497_c0_g1~~TRINITY_DN3497_c0_g1_i3.p1  ORF type:complete len:385 (-),score=134.33 TRINITY_DN3497_c0_g1_i3:92-1246(-)